MYLTPGYIKIAPTAVSFTKTQKKLRNNKNFRENVKTY